MVWTYSSQDERNTCNICVAKTYEKKQLWRLCFKWANNFFIKTDFRKKKVSILQGSSEFSLLRIRSICASL